MAEKEPTQRTEKGLEIPVPTRKDWDDTLAKIVKPKTPRPDPDEQDRADDASDD